MSLEKTTKLFIFNKAELKIKPNEVMDGMKLMEAVFESGENNKVVYF